MAIEMDLPVGTAIEPEELVSLGFVRRELNFRTSDFGSGQCEWDTAGQIPDSGGLYAFVLHPVEEPQHHRVVYVGLTGHLWMVTKGRLPDGSSRPAQRYGRHQYAGATRARINGLVAAAKASGYEVTHWLSPQPVPADIRPDLYLRSAEEALIARWRLRETGWNRG